jgi:hypothetical protein
MGRLLRILAVEEHIRYTKSDYEFQATRGWRAEVRWWGLGVKV